MIPPEIVQYLNLALNVLAIVVVAGVAVWLRRNHIENVQLKGQLLGMILALRLTINGKGGNDDDASGRSHPDD